MTAMNIQPMRDRYEAAAAIKAASSSVAVSTPTPPRYDALQKALTEMAREMTARSESWFPHVHRTPEALLLHLTMGVAEEGGEVLGVAKKWARYDLPFSATEMEKLHMEMADLLTYLTMLGLLVVIDWPSVIAAMVDKCEQRWGVVPNV